MPSARRITNVKLADGKEYPFAEIPASASLLLRVSGHGLEGSEAAAARALAMTDACAVSLRMAGVAERKIPQVLLLIDSQDPEVTTAIVRSVFPAAMFGGAPGQNGMAAGAGAAGGTVGAPAVGDRPS